MFCKVLYGQIWSDFGRPAPDGRPSGQFWPSGAGRIHQRTWTAAGRIWTANNKTSPLLYLYSLKEKIEGGHAVRCRTHKSENLDVRAAYHSVQAAAWTPYGRRTDIECNVVMKARLLCCCGGCYTFTYSCY